MIEIRIPKEIREYQEKIMLGMTLKQVISIGVAGVVTIPLYFAINPIFGMDITSFILLIVSAPIVAWGFVKVGGMDASAFVKMFIINTFFMPANRKYETENFFEEVADIINDREYEEIKPEFEQTRIAEQKELQRGELALRRKMATSAKTTSLSSQKPVAKAAPAPRPASKKKLTKEEKLAAKADKKQNGWKKSQITNVIEQKPEETDIGVKEKTE